MEISARDVMRLREKTGIGMMKCKEALADANGDFDKAIEILRKQGLEAADRRAGRETSEGRIGFYVHHTGKVAAMVELRCESDFVASNAEFRQFANNLCMHIVAANPIALDRSQIPPEIIEKEREIYREQVKGKPPQVVEKIVEGKLNKFYQERCLLEQPFVLNQDETVEQHLKRLIDKFGENMRIVRFVRFQLGE